MTDTAQSSNEVQGGGGYEKTLRVRASADALFDALTSVAGLAGWWTAVTGSGEAGGDLAFVFSSPDPCVMHVDEAIRPTSVRWHCTECAFLPEWVGTHPHFSIRPIDADACELRFRHHGLTSQLECIEECTSGWNHSLASLREYVESGRGMPFGSEGHRAHREAEAKAGIRS